MANILYIDTSTDAGTVFVAGNHTVLATRDTEIARNHAASINMMIHDVLNEAGLEPALLEGIAVCAGPGSYTGLRIGMGTAKGMCYALDKPMMAHNRLTMLAYQASVSRPGYSHYAVMVTARVGEYFLALYDENFNCNIAPMHVGADEVFAKLGGAENTYFITDASEDFVKTLGVSVVDNDLTISKIHWVQYAINDYNCNDFVSLSGIEPFYLKDVYTHK